MHHQNKQLKYFSARFVDNFVCGILVDGCAGRSTLLTLGVFKTHPDMKHLKPQYGMCKSKSEK